jgi:3-deoxy-manno-octulosonate cytidylyltransferase (CMP-KDO synthetase)
VDLTGAYETGTDRVAAVAEQAGHTGPTDWVLNVQGDEPLIDPADVSRLVAARHASPDVRMATLVYPIRSEREYRDPHIVKVVLDQARRAMYFSRAAIPHHRDAPPGSDAVWQGAWRHLGVYLFRGDFLQAFRAIEPTPLALGESLEQLRALEHGHAIHCVEAHSLSPGVDVPDDLAHAEALLREQAGD